MYPQPKPQRGEHVLDREAQRLELRKAEAIAKTKAKVRDSFTCRWPEKHVCRGPLEGAHIFYDKGMGGDHGTVSDTWNILTLCSWIHRRGPVSIHGKQLKVEAETPYGADWCCSFWRRDEFEAEWRCVGVESAIGVIRKV